MLKLIDLPFKCRLPTTKLQPSLFVSHLIFLSFFTSTYQQKRLYFFHHKIVFVHTTNPCLSWKKRTKKIYFLLYAHAYSWRGSNPRCLFLDIENLLILFFLSNFVCNGTYTLARYLMFEIIIVSMISLISICVL